MGARQERVDEIWGGVGHDWEFFKNFFKVTENAFIMIKLLTFFHFFSDVAIGSQNSLSLN